MGGGRIRPVDSLHKGPPVSGSEFGWFNRPPRPYGGCAELPLAPPAADRWVNGIIRSHTRSSCNPRRQPQRPSVVDHEDDAAGFSQTFPLSHFSCGCVVATRTQHSVKYGLRNSPHVPPTWGSLRQFRDAPEPPRQKAEGFSLTQLGSVGVCFCRSKKAGLFCPGQNSPRLAAECQKAAPPALARLCAQADDADAFLCTIR